MFDAFNTGVNAPPAGSEPVAAAAPAQQNLPIRNTPIQNAPGGTPVPPQPQQPGAQVPPQPTANPAQPPYPQNRPPQWGYVPAGTRAYPPPKQTKQKPKKEPFPLTRPDVVMAGAVVVLAVFGVAASFWGGFRLGYALSYALTFLVYAIYFRAEHKRATLFSMLTGLLSFAMSASFVLTSNVEVRVMSVLAMGVGGMLYLSSLSGSKRVAGDLGVLGTLHEGVGASASNSIRSLRSLVSSGNGKISALSKVFLGFLISLPLLVIVVPLLMRADFAFEGLVRSLFSNLALRMVQLLLGLLLVPLLLGFAFSSKYREDRPVKARTRKGADAVLLTSVLAVLSAVYLLYLIAQYKYFFGEKPAGFTLSEYARRGFFELCGIAAINFVLLYTFVLIARKKESGSLPGALKGVGTFIGVFTLVITGTALAKMALYIKGYGLTVLRLSTSAFMAFLAVVFVALILRLFLPKVNVLRVLIVSALACLLVLGVGNVNRVVAQYNLKAYETGALAVLDVRYLGELGDEGVVALCRAAKTADDATAVKAYAVLAHELDRYYAIGCDADDGSPYVAERTRGKFSQWSFCGAEAYAALEDLMSDDTRGDVMDVYAALERDPFLYETYWEAFPDAK
ncbi:MAG: DUF4173 domain-containing protein [Clostridia bacterium]|nr:DUF4173 domain-containing protein [Clostridia bacterium]